MSFVIERAKTGRRPGYIVDVHWDTGTERYCDFNVPIGEDMRCIVGKIVVAPTRKSTGSGVGSRAKYSIQLNDSVADDGNGTVLGRLLAANGFWHKRAIDVYVGYVTEPFDITNFQKRSYFIDNISPLNDKNYITINTIDPLESLNDRRSVVPLPTVARLEVAISDSFTGNVDVEDTNNFDASGYAVIDEEYVTYTLVDADTINITARGQLGTDAEAHNIEAPVKNSYVKLVQNVVDLIRDLIINFTDLPASYIDNAEWNQERDDYLASEDMDLTVATSESVKDVINDLCRQAGVAIWWDERDGEIKIKSDSPAVFPDFYLNTNENVLDKNHAQTQDMQKLVTRVVFHYNKINKAGDDKQENYANTAVAIDAAAEASQQSKGIVEIFGKYVRNSGTALKVSSRLQNRRGNGAREVTFDLDPKDGDVWTGSEVRLESDLFQDANGDPRAFAIEITEVKEADGLRYNYKGTIISDEPHNLYALIGPNTLVDYVDESQFNRDRYGFISTDGPPPEMSDGTPAYRIL